MDKNVYFCDTSQEQIASHAVSCKTETELSCRKCGTVLSRTTNTSTSVPAVADPFDIAAVDEWIQNASLAFETLPAGDDHVVWVRYVNRRLHRLAYNPESQHIIRAEVLVADHNERIVGRPDVLQQRLASFNVQPVGSRTSSFHYGEWKSGANWGAARYLSTHTLHTDLLQTLFDDLESTISQIIDMYGEDET